VGWLSAAALWGVRAEDDSGDADRSEDPNQTSLDPHNLSSSPTQGQGSSSQTQGQDEAKSSLPPALPAPPSPPSIPPPAPIWNPPSPVACLLAPPPPSAAHFIDCRVHACPAASQPGHELAAYRATNNARPDPCAHLHVPGQPARWVLDITPDLPPHDNKHPAQWLLSNASAWKTLKGGLGIRAQARLHIRFLKTNKPGKANLGVLAMTVYDNSSEWDRSHWVLKCVDRPCNSLPSLARDMPGSLDHPSLVVPAKIFCHANGSQYIEVMKNVVESEGFRAKSLRDHLSEGTMHTRRAVAVVTEAVGQQVRSMHNHSFPKGFAKPGHGDLHSSNVMVAVNSSRPFQTPRVYFIDLDTFGNCVISVCHPRVDVQWLLMHVGRVMKRYAWRVQRAAQQALLTGYAGQKLRPPHTDNTETPWLALEPYIQPLNRYWDDRFGIIPPIEKQVSRFFYLVAELSKSAMAEAAMRSTRYNRGFGQCFWQPKHLRGFALRDCIREEHIKAASETKYIASNDTQ